ncbi:MAG: hypothetical protein QOJ64_3768 [Acidobacteriota bacterium]|nr:hypothetical protein [Acidobacteriota bacterium]
MRNCDQHRFGSRPTSRSRAAFAQSITALRLPLLLLCFTPNLIAQEQKPPDQTDEVVRISTELVQTDVMVFDSSGRFVEGLKPDQFELRVDGKRQVISFFERVTAGKFDEEAQLAAARGATIAKSPDATVRPLDRGRSFFFLVDDLHQAAGSLARTRKTLLDFVDNEMGQNDQLAIASVSGQIGFLQQLTNNKSVLRAAVARLNLPSQTFRDNQRPPMSEPMAVAIDSESDPALLTYFMEPLMRDGTPENAAESIVKSRAKNILGQSGNITRNVLATLESLARRMAGLPGRKLLFFISDGFILNTNDNEMFDRLRNITNAAARNNLVIYSLDARGLSAGVLGDATSDIAIDRSGRTSRYTTGDVSLSQEPLRVLAANTGGRALLNSNSATPVIAKAVEETSVYYLLAWRPDSQKAGGNKFRRIEVIVSGRHDLTVSVRSGYYDLPASVPDSKQAAARPHVVRTADDELRTAINSTFSAGAIPTWLGLIYLDVPEKGLLLAASLRIPSRSIGFDQAGEKRKGAVDLAGVVMNDRGKSVASFRDHLELSLDSSASSGAPPADLVYNYQTVLAPGLYQVRVAARDNKSGLTGSAAEWIEIPDLSSGQLALSSILFGELPKEENTSKPNPVAESPPRASIDRTFSRSSKLRFMEFIYNAARGRDDAGPDVALQVQILRDDQPVVTTPLKKVDHGDSADLGRLTYAAEISLASMLPGRYVLQITVIDRIAKTTASQRSDFEIE